MTNTPSSGLFPSGPTSPNAFTLFHQSPRETHEMFPYATQGSEARGRGHSQFQDTSDWTVQETYNVANPFPEDPVIPLPDSTGTKVTEIQFPSTTNTPRAPSDGAGINAGQSTPAERRASTGRPASGPAVTEIELPSSRPESLASPVPRVVEVRSAPLKGSLKQLFVACPGLFLLVHGFPEMG
ncbi:hypothetical protein GGG16DRAFT_100262 [Schizophyllum commune]